MCNFKSEFKLKVILDALKENRFKDNTTAKIVSGLLEDHFRGNLVPANELPPRPEKLLSDIGILQNEAQVLKNQLQSQKEVIIQLQNTIQSLQKSNDTYIQNNIGGKTELIPSIYPKYGGEYGGESEKNIPKYAGEYGGESQSDLQVYSPESLKIPLSEYKEYLQPQSPQFSQEEKNEFLEKIQNLENKYQTWLSSLQLVLLYLCTCLITQKEV